MNCCCLFASPVEVVGALRKENCPYFAVSCRSSGNVITSDLCCCSRTVDDTEMNFGSASRQDCAGVFNVRRIDQRLLNPYSRVTRNLTAKRRIIQVEFP